MLTQKDQAMILSGNGRYLETDACIRWMNSLMLQVIESVLIPMNTATRHMHDRRPAQLAGNRVIGKLVASA